MWPLTIPNGVWISIQSAWLLGLSPGASAPGRFQELSCLCLPNFILPVDIAWPKTDFNKAALSPGGCFPISAEEVPAVRTEWGSCLATVIINNQSNGL